MNHTSKPHIPSLIIAVILLASCGRPTVPQTYDTEARQPRIMPDYTDVTMPPNICPPTFVVQETGRQAAVRLSAHNQSYTYGSGMDVVIDATEWATLTQAARGGSIKVEVFVEEGNRWKSYQPFDINIANDEIDPYISYRLIPPSYVAYNHMMLAERNLTTYDETVFYDNQAITTKQAGQCVNCHSYQNYHTDHMLFHMRHSHAGTIIVDGDDIKKINTKTDCTISAGVYPSWHPTLNLVAFSTNHTGQTFHTKDIAKIEVQDTKSDIIIYDIDRNAVSTVANDSDELEVFPTWSADGHTLYYCSAHFEHESDSLVEDRLITQYQDIKYNIYSKTFDPQTRQFGPRQLVFDAASIGKSATLPRISPDGRYMIFALGPWGCFHVWHPESDIHIIDLDTHNAEPLAEINSKRSESYPSFSSNGRWIMTASRRDDGNYTRPYIAYFDKNGHCHRPFELPQQDPHHYQYLLFSFNRPEFMCEPVPYTAGQFAAKALKPATNATYNGKENAKDTDKPAEEKRFTTFSETS